MGFQFVFEFVFIGYFAGFIPLLAGVVVGNVPEFGCRPAVSVKRTSHLGVIGDATDVGTACCRHPLLTIMSCLLLYIVEYPAMLLPVDCVIK
jgi:hypothetical protein